jgi:chromosome segregation ATPase
MRSILLAFLLLLSLSAAAGSSHRTHIVDDDIELRIVRSDDEHWASYRNEGVRYRTSNASVLAELERALEPHRELGREHSRLGRKHSELGREHSRLGREHSRLGREHSRLSRERDLSDREVERRRRDLEEEQRKLEAEQRKLEDRQRDLESEQREVERKRSALERDAYREIERIFERAAREGKATKE